MASQDMKILKFSGGMPPDPPRLSCYAAEFASATNLFTIYLSMWQSTLIIKLIATATPTDHVPWPDWFKIASYGPALHMCTQCHYTCKYVHAKILHFLHMYVTLYCRSYTYEIYDISTSRNSAYSHRSTYV